MADLSSVTPGTLTLRSAAADGRGVKSAVTEYAVTSASDTDTTDNIQNTPPADGWQTDMPAAEEGQYLWTRVTINYTDGANPTVYYSVSRIGKNGDNLTIASKSVTYAVTDDSAQPADDQFTYETVPPVGLGQYLWSKTTLTYSDGEPVTQYSVSRVGNDGKTVEGTSSFLHIAYATSADGKEGFSTTYFSGAAYIGTCVTETSEDPDDYEKYEWARFLGESGMSPALLTLTASSQVFKYGKQTDGTLASTPTPESVKLTAEVQNVSTPSYKWAYKSADADSFTDISANESRTLDVSPDDSMWGSGRVLTVRCTETTSKAYDEMTLAKLYDGELGKQGEQGVQGDAGKDAYTVILTNESHTFAAGESAVETAQTATCKVLAYKGTTQVAATIGTISTGQTYLTATKYSNGTTSAYFAMTAKAGLSAKSGTVSIPITVDGQTFTKIFSWALSFKGAQGDPGDPGKNGADGLTPAANLIYGSAFNSGRDLNEWAVNDLSATNNDYPVTTGQKTAVFSGSAGSDSLAQTLWKSDGSVSRLLPDTWYTLSFYLRADTPAAVRFYNRVRNKEHTSETVLIDTATKGYADGAETALAANGKTSFAKNDALDTVNGWQRHTLTFKTGAAVGVNKNLLGSAGFPSAYANDWTAVGLSSRSTAAVGSLSMYFLLFSANGSSSSVRNILSQTLFKSDGTVSRVKAGTWYTFSFYIKGASAGSASVWIWNGSAATDTGAGQLADGTEETGTGYHSFTLTTSYARHSFTFKTQDALGSDDISLIFQQPASGVSLYITQPKLEEGKQATAFVISEGEDTTPDKRKALSETRIAFQDTIDTTATAWMACPKLELGKTATPWSMADEEKAGLDGCVIRTTEWQEGTEYRNDTDTTPAQTATGVRYIDVVTITGADGSLSGVYQCKKTHTSSTDDKPGSGANKDTCWQQFDQMAPIYTSLIMAENGVIRLLQSNTILIQDNSETPVASTLIQGGDWPILIGGGGSVPTADTAVTAFKSDGSGRLAAGNITWDAAGNAAFAGFLMKKKTVITSDNYESYTIEAGTDGDSNTYRGLVASRLGGFVELGDGAPNYIYFPTCSYSDGEIDSSLAFVGATIVIKNSTGSTVYLGNVRRLKFYPASSNSLATAADSVYDTAIKYALSDGKCAYLECVYATDKVCWVMRSYNPGTSTTFTQGTLPDNFNSNIWATDPTVNSGGA